MLWGVFSCAELQVLLSPCLQETGQLRAARRQGLLERWMLDEKWNSSFQMGNAAAWTASKTREVVVNAGVLSPSWFARAQELQQDSELPQKCCQSARMTRSWWSVSLGALPFLEAPPSLQGPPPASLPALDTRGFRRSHRALESKFQSSWINYKSSKFWDNFCFK